MKRVHISVTLPNGIVDSYSGPFLSTRNADNSLTIHEIASQRGFFEEWILGPDIHEAAVYLPGSWVKLARKTEQ